MIGYCRLTNPKLIGNQQPANAAFDEIAVDLLAEMGARVLQPAEDLQATLAGKGA